MRRGCGGTLGSPREKKIDLIFKVGVGNKDI